MTARKLKIAVISASSKSFSTRRLVEAGKARGHSVRVLDPNNFSIIVESGEPMLHYRGKPVAQYDAIIPRVGASITFFGTAVVRQFEQMDVFCVNSARAIIVSRDKLRSIQMLSRHGVGLPKTAFVKSREGVLPAIQNVGGAPVIVKLLEGTQGIGVILAETEKVAEAIVETLQSAKQNVLIQAFVSESRGRDVRAFVVGSRVVGAIRRVAVGDEFRSNVHRGGRAEAITLTSEQEAAAVRAAQVMGLRVAGVDMLEGADGPQVMEVNSSPGLEGIEGATGEDIAGEIISYIEKEVLFPEIDIRQRLTARAGYAVVEMHVDKKSPLAGHTLGYLQLREKGVEVLSISRGSEVIPIPPSDAEIHEGDMLLCFGRSDVLRGLVPVRKKKRKKKKKVSSS